jgi:HAD superfamily phosphatase (TIGR01668 family)
MSLLLPTVALKQVTDITIELLQSMGARAIFLDVDNTLARHGSQIPFEGAVAWTHRVREEGIEIIIISNNLKSRVAPFAKQFDLPFVCFAQKPFPLGMPYAKKLLGRSAKEIVVVGDQIFTDVLGANLAGMKSILLEPKAEEDSMSFRFRRWLEHSIRRKIEQRKGDVHGG